MAIHAVSELFAASKNSLKSIESVGSTRTLQTFLATHVGSDVSRKDLHRRFASGTPPHRILKSTPQLANRLAILRHCSHTNRPELPTGSSPGNMERSSRDKTSLARTFGCP